MNKTYQFSPIQFILLDMFVIGLPSFFLALQPNTNPIKGKFITNLAKNSLPAGICLVGSTIAMYIYQISTGISTEVLVTMSSIAIVTIGFIALFRQCKPLNLFKSIMFIACSIITIVCVWMFYDVFKYVPISKQDLLFLIVVCQAAYPTFIALHNIFESSSRTASSE